MPATFTIRMHVGNVERVLTVMEAAFDDASELMDDVLLVMIRSVQLNFEAQGRPDQWAEHAPSTKARRGEDALILRDEGLLLQSMGGGANGAFATADGFGEADEFSAIIGTNRPGWQNQFPDSRGWRPAREMVLFQDQDEEDILDMAAHWTLRAGPYSVA